MPETTLLEPLRLLGWDDAWQSELDKVDKVDSDEALLPARVTAAERFHYLLSGDEDVSGRLSGPLRKLAHVGERPVSGDWVAYRLLGDEAVIEAVLPRRSKFSRKRPRSEAEQVLAANADHVFLVMSLVEDFNVSRLERYLTAAASSGAEPVVVLTKSDLLDTADADARLAELAEAVRGVKTHVVSNKSGEGLQELYRYLGPGRTVALLGSSGAGKSSLANSLLGVELATAEAGQGGRGRHTTTRRQLVVSPRGCLLDTPGLRELALLESQAPAEAFDDIEELARKCRFNDCSHRVEPGCAVRSALESGIIERRRLDSWRKLNG